VWSVYGGGLWLLFAGGVVGPRGGGVFAGGGWTPGGHYEEVLHVCLIS